MPSWREASWIMMSSPPPTSAWARGSLHPQLLDLLNRVQDLVSDLKQHLESRIRLAGCDQHTLDVVATPGREILRRNLGILLLNTCELRAKSGHCSTKRTGSNTPRLKVKMDDATTKR